MSVSSVLAMKEAAATVERTMLVAKKTQDCTKDQAQSLADLMKSAPMPEGVGTRINVLA